MRVLRDRNAGLYLTGVVVSGFGTSAMALASGVWVKSLTGSSSLAALAGVCLWAPTLAGPLIGPLADRARRRTVVVRTNLAMAVVLLALLAVDSADRVAIVFAVMTVYGAAGVLVDAAENALVGTGLDPGIRGDFNGLRMSANEGMKLLAPLAGAGLYVHFGGRAVALLDAATFALAAGVFALVRIDEPAPARAPGHWLRDTADGIRFTRADPVLRRLVAAGAVAMAAAGINGAAVYAVVDDGLDRGPAFAGVLYAVQGAGSVAAGIAAGPLMRRFSERTFAAGGIALFALGILVRGAPSTPLALAGSVLIGAGLPCALIAAMTAVQRVTPDAMLGRVAATAGTVMFAPNAVTGAAGAGVLAFADYRILLAAAAVIAAAGAFVAAPLGRRPPADVSRGSAGSTEAEQAAPRP